MASSSFAQLRAEIRRDFRDELGTMFSDDQLDAMIDEGQREYCLATGCLHGSCEVVVPFGGGFIRTPSDFIRPERLVGCDGRDIQIVESSFLFRGRDWREEPGLHPVHAVFDFDSWGLFRIVPQPEDYTKIGTLHYQRTPNNGVLEIKDIGSLREYALFLAYTYSASDKAESHYTRWNDLVAQRRAKRGSLYARPRVRTGNYF